MHPCVGFAGAPRANGLRKDEGVFQQGRKMKQVIHDRRRKRLCGDPSPQGHADARPLPNLIGADFLYV